MWAAVRHKPDLAKMLLDAGADTEATNAWGRNALFLAAWEGQVDIVVHLLKAGANASSCALHDEWTALHKACEMGNAELVQILLHAGADPMARTQPDKSFKNGVTPVELAPNAEIKEIIQQAARTRVDRMALGPKDEV
mmetsp:Transcript_9241/g.16143  ORF Transcript_9241/g.16143 Transcript_9241/m.16143 type:complete len:138 (-) Transcript_9241:72-485(-)